VRAHPQLIRRPRLVQGSKVSKVKWKRDELHWTCPCALWDNHPMAQNEGFPRRSILNWLGVGALALLAVGLIQLSKEAQPARVPKRTSPQASPTVDLSSPLTAAMSSPLAAATTVATAKPSPTSTASAADFQLTVLHTNDAWGYLLPCG
jgi:hypothetical protein